MKILVLSPFGAKEPFGIENLRKVARPDTEVHHEDISNVYPLKYLSPLYYKYKAIDGCVDRIMKAEQEGYDSAVISCMYDPGLLEARDVVDIPITGALESSTHIASMMGFKYSILTVLPMVNYAWIHRILQIYGVSENCASVRPIPIHVLNLYSNYDEVVKQTISVAKRCVEEDGAEVIIPGCTIQQAVFTHELDNDPVDVIGAPVIDGMVTGLKMAETMVDLHQKAGYPAVSRRGLYGGAPREELLQLRKFMGKKDDQSPAVRTIRGRETKKRHSF